jgi:hypothetical protein
MVVHRWGGMNVLWRLSEHDVKLSTKYVLKERGTSTELGKECTQLYLSNIVTACAPPFSPDRLAYAPTCLERMWTESLKLQTWGSLMVQIWGQYSQYFFKKAYKNCKVLKLRPGSWHERPWSINTPHGWKVLNLFLLFHFQPDSYQQQIILCTNLKEKHFSMGEYKTPTSVVPNCKLLELTYRTKT